ncbi:BON domain-containing protein [Actimicrobium antarcticum]|uniref:BON domain-containing protein n=1 Tax=Actimicrobium antarcticum TaxID=1051899 RepID=A0ABP7T6E9_9BURK
MIDWARRTWPRASRPLATVLLCGVVATGLQGCIEMAIGTAVMGTLAATDRRTLGAQTEDKAIAVKAETRIPQVVGDAGHVNTASFNRRVLLTGEVRDAKMKADVEREVAGIEAVKSVINELQVTGLSDYTSRANDALLTSKVKASFVDTKDLYANSIKVVTERNAVYLMGRVTNREANMATEVARGVSGVQKVVKVFEIIDDEELRQLSTSGK